MYISEIEKPGEYAFKYLYGKSALNNSGGWWIIYYPDPIDKGNGTSIPFLKIDWKKENNNITSMTYTYIIPPEKANAENYGTFIKYERSTSNLFDRTFTMNIKSYPNNTSLNEKPIIIQWHNTNKNGQITIDGMAWGCWDNNYVNKEACAL